jgi:hypothetical protein
VGQWHYRYTVGINTQHRGQQQTMQCLPDVRLTINLILKLQAKK